VTLTRHPLLVPWSRKSRATHLLPLWAVRPIQSLSACTTAHFTFTYTSTPLCAVGPLQSLSACTMVHFNFTYTSKPPMSRTACTEPQCLYNDALYLYLYLYSHYVPYGLYRISVPVQRCTLPLPIPLTPLCAVRPVQNLSACTTVHFTFTYTSTPLCAVRPVQSLSGCTTVYFTFTYTSTPPKWRTACTEPQCLYNGALYRYLYLYFPYVPYGLYRASVPLQRCTLPLAIPLPPLSAVRPVQSLSACTTVHFTFFTRRLRVNFRAGVFKYLQCSAAKRNCNLNV